MNIRFLPLSLSGTILGILLAAADFKISILSSVFIILTVCILHTVVKYKWGIVACVISALLMIQTSFGTILSLDSFCFMLLTGAAISAARKYRLGDDTSERKDMNDPLSILLLGFASVLGPYFISAHTVTSWYMLLPAASMGFLCTSALRINSKTHHLIYMATGWLCMIAYCIFRFYDPWHYLFIASLPLFLLHIKQLWSSKVSTEALETRLAGYIFVFAALAGFGFIKFLLV